MVFEIIYDIHLKVLDNGIIKQLKIQVPTYNKTPPLETMCGVLRTWENCGGHYMGKAGASCRWHYPYVLLDILSRG